MTDLELELLTTPPIDPLTDRLLVLGASSPLYDAVMREVLG